MKMLIAIGALATILAPATVEARHTAHSGYGSDYYTNVDGRSVHRPVHTRGKPAGATARCGDGSWSFSQHHRGTCSHHGGVASWM